MEKKVPWNLRVFESIATDFDAKVEKEYRGDKGTSVSAACLLFLLMPAQVRQAVIDAVKLAEGRGSEGTVLQSARKEWSRRTNFEALLEELETIAVQSADPHAASPPAAKPSGGRKAIG